jgi:hypothetical protein
MPDSAHGREIGSHNRGMPERSVVIYGKDG